MNSIEVALDKALSARIGKLYDTPFKAMVAAGSNTQKKNEAQRRFKKGLQLAEEALTRAKQSAAN